VEVSLSIRAGAVYVLKLEFAWGVREWWSTLIVEASLPFEGPKARRSHPYLPTAVNVVFRAWMLLERVASGLASYLEL
jgi:hypothetical protein